MMEYPKTGYWNMKAYAKSNGIVWKMYESKCKEVHL